MPLHSLFPFFGGRDPAPLSLLEIDHHSFAAHHDLRFGRLLHCWTKLSGGRLSYPARTDIDPTQIGPDLLPNLFLADIVQGERGTFRYRYRLIGQEILDYGTGRPGRYLHEMAQSDVSIIEDHYEAAIKGRISLRRSDLSWLDKRLAFVRYSAMVLPLADDGRMPTHLLGLCLYDRWGGLN